VLDNEAVAKALDVSFNPHRPLKTGARDGNATGDGSERVSILTGP